MSNAKVRYRRRRRHQRLQWLWSELKRTLEIILPDDPLADLTTSWFLITPMEYNG